VPLEIVSRDGDLIVARVHGLVEFAEWAKVQREFLDVVERSGPVRILLIFKGFEGWARSEKWGDPSLLTFDQDEHIRAVAIVVEPHWKDEVAAFSLVEFRNLACDFFTDEASARGWLEEVARS
jgi:hypothetical protein